MAGDGKPVLAIDPALTKYNNMVNNRHKFFRWTPRTAWLTITYVVLVPAAFGYLGYTTEGKYDLRGKLRGNTIVER